MIKGITLTYTAKYSLIAFVRMSEPSITLNALDAARENLKIYNRTVDAVTDFNSNLVKTWTSYWSAQQQHIYRA